jgi:hypothetical protein
LRDIVTPRRVFALWWPLAASSLLMSSEMPIINSGVARTPNPEVALAGLAVAATLANLIESPVLMLIGATAALGTDRAMVRMLRRFMLALGLGMTAVYFLISFSPLADVILREWLGVPPAVADAALPALRILIFWPFPTGWRRFHQGILIRLRRTRVISMGTIFRLSVTIGVTILTMAVLRLPGNIGGAVTTASAVTAEAFIATYWARRVLSEVPEADEPSMDYRQLIGFYAPLVMVSMMSILADPLISTSLARAPFPTESLAAWPVVWGLTSLVAAFCAPLQETTISLADRREALPAIRRIGFLLGAGATSLLALLALTPLADFYFGQIIGLSAALRAFTNSAILMLIPYPLLQACEMMLRGFLIKQQRTSSARLGMACYLVLLTGSLLAGSFLHLGNGTQIAAVAVLVAISGEIGLLAWQARKLTAVSYQLSVASSQ